MEKRKINNFEVPLLGLGCMRLPILNNDPKLIDEELATKMIDYAYNHQVNYFDTAYPYHQNQSEIFLGKALKKYKRETFYLATKMPIWECSSKEDVENMFYNQLKRLQVDYFDFYLCHAMNKNRHNDYIKYEAYDFLEKMKKEGKIKNLGFSYHDTPDNLTIILDTLKWDFAQLQINYLDWQLQDAKKQYETLVKYNVACIVMEPIRGGSLANIKEEAYNLFKSYDKNSTPAKYALRYVGSLENVKVVLSGMSNLEQLVENINTFTNFKKLNEEEIKIISEAKDIILGSNFVPCTGCEYCLPCKFNVQIKEIFSIYNQYIIDKNYQRFQRRINNLKSDEQPNNCKECKVCMKKCPQNINIVEELKKIKEVC